VQIERLDDGTRHVTAISEVQRMEGDVITLQPLFEFKLDQFTHDGKVIGNLAPTGLRPAFLPKFKRHGIELADDLFGTPSNAMFGVEGEDNPAQWVRAEGAR
jgi:pilus assembly protein CpaF